MDGNRFDEFSRRLAEPRSRRAILGVLGAAIVGALSPHRTAAAPKADKPSKCYGGGSSCTNAKQCCSGVCTNRRCEQECVSPSDCAGSVSECQIRTCNSGVCGVANVAAGTALASQVSGDCLTRVCDGNGGVTTAPNATDVVSDGNQCTDDVCVGGVPAHPPLAAGTSCSQNGGSVCNGTGACVVCLPGSTQTCYTGPQGTLNQGICTAGTATCLADGSGYGPCAGEVTPGQETVCNGIDEDCNGVADNGVVCPPVPNATAFCASGQCVLGACTPGFANCDNNPATGCEINITADPRNCGGCGRVCPPVPNGNVVCQGGTCVTFCNGGFFNCGGQCVDIQNDEANCGGCGRFCAGTCRSGLCSIF